MKFKHAIIYLFLLAPLVTPTIQIAMNNNNGVSKKECPGCMDKKEIKDFPTLSCGHSAICTNCYIDKKDGCIGSATKDNIGILLKCSQMGCGKAIAKDDVLKIAGTNEYNRINTILNANHQDTLKKPCPTPDCQFSFMITDWKTRPEIKCPSCKNHFCLTCNEQHSKAISCTEYKKNKEGKMSDEERATLLNIKPCPKCNKNIEKIDGCLHMTCDSCGHHWCWVCLKPYKNALGAIVNHANFYECNGITDTTDKISVSTPTENALQYLVNHRYQKRVDNLSASQKNKLEHRINTKTETDPFKLAIRKVDLLNSLEEEIRISNRNKMRMLYASTIIVPITIAVRIAQWVKNPVAIKNAIEKLNAIIETAQSNPNDTLAHLIKEQHALTLSNENIATLRELALREQYKEFIRLAQKYKRELQDMTAPNAGFSNGCKKIRWGLSADLLKCKHFIYSKLKRG